MGRIVETAAERDFAYAGLALSGVQQVIASRLESLFPHPFEHGGTRFLEQAVQVTRGYTIFACYLVRAKVTVHVVLFDVTENAI